MKKSTLVALALAVSATGFAQMTNSNNLGRKQQVSPVQVASDRQAPAVRQNMAESLPAASRQLATKAPRRSAATGVFYHRPAGTYWYGWSDSWTSFYAKVLFCLPVGDNEFVNACTNPLEAVWSLETAQGSYPLTGEEGTNNYIWSGMDYDAANDTYDNGFNMFYTPTISVGTDSYTLKEDNIVDGTAYGAVLSAAGRPSRMAKSPIEGCYSYWSDGKGGYGGDIYGTEAGIDYDFDGDEVEEHYLIKGIWEIHEAPVSPLYVEEMVMLARVNQDNSAPVIAEDAPLKIYITNVEYDEEGNAAPGDQIIAELSCTQDDVERVAEGKTIYGYNMKFANRETDFLGNVTTIPFIIDQEYAIIMDWSAEGAKVRFGANDFARQDDDIYARTAGYMILQDEKGDIGYTTLSYSNVTLTPMFIAMFDYVAVYDVLYGNDGTEYTDMNVLTAPVEGGNMWESKAENVNLFAYTRPFLSWFDENDNENYYIEDAPDWIPEYVVEEDTEGEDASGFTFVSFKVDPLPAGVDGRYAIIHITGKGCVSKPIFIVQGDVDITGIQSAVKSAKTTGMTYNLAGQRVAAGTKGLVIRDGKKYINK